MVFFLGCTVKDKELSFLARSKKNDEWVLTNIGKGKGAEVKKGQYGDYIAYPDTVLKELM